MRGLYREMPYLFGIEPVVEDAGKIMLRLMGIDIHNQ